MSMVVFLPLVLAAADPAWETDYSQAVKRATREKKDLVIIFQKDHDLGAAVKDAAVAQRLAKFVCLKVPTTYAFKGQLLLNYPALVDMKNQAGLAIVSYHDDKLPQHGYVISAHPLLASRYAWAPEYGVEQLKLILDLPLAATLTQRSMIYAISVHPEQPQSVFSQMHPAFLKHAESHCWRQASMNHQHHANLGTVMNALQGQVDGGLGNASEVVAESWGSWVGGENVLEASFACVNAWRQSPGHWGAVSSRHRYFGYDIARSANGTWFATGIFAR